MFVGHVIRKAIGKDIDQIDIQTDTNNLNGVRYINKNAIIPMKVNPEIT